MEAAWNAFGSESDSSDSDDDNDGAGREEATRLMQQYNTQSAQDKQSSITCSSNSTSISYQPSFHDQKQRTALLPWPNNPPLYLGPAFVEKLTLGGGRGYVATEDLPPGTCILIEEPFVKGWSEQQMGKRLGLESIQHLFDRDTAQSIVQCMEELHPTKDKVDSVYRDNSEDIAPLDKI